MDDSHTNTAYLYLVRHGATASNLADPPILQGNSIDDPLSERGRWQATRVADELAEHPMRAVYASPMRRAQETAAVVAARHDLPVVLVPQLVEVDVGQWEGRSWVDIEREEPEAYEQFIARPDLYGYRGGESLSDVADRVVPAIEQILDRHLGERIVAVAHNVVNRVFLTHALGIPPAHARSLTQNNGGINLVRRRNGKTKLVTLNYVPYAWADDSPAPE